MKSLLEELESLIDALEWSDEDLDKAKEVAGVLADLTRRSLTGEDVDEEMKLAMASARNLQAAGVVSVANTLANGIAGFIEKLLDRAL